MAAEMKETFAAKIEQLLSACNFPPYAKLKTGKEIAGYIIKPREDGGCDIYYQPISGEYIPTDTRRANREWKLQSYLGILLDYGYPVQYVPEVGILDDPAHRPYQQPSIVCCPRPVKKVEEPFIWREDDRNEAYNAAPDDTRAYIEALENAVKAAVRFRLNIDKEHSRAFFESVKILNFLKEEGE